MKIQHLIAVAAVVFATGCDTPRNTTSTTSTSNTAAGPVPSASVVVPETIKSAFNTRYPQADNAVWSKYAETTVPIEWDLTDWPALDNDDFVVKYNVGPDHFYAWYDSGGNWIGSSMTLKDFAALPAPVTNRIGSNYAGYVISSANMEYWKDRSAYEVELRSSSNKAKVLIDPGGNIIKEKIKALN